MPTPREAYTNTVEQQGYSNARLQAADYGAAGEITGRALQGFGDAVGKGVDALDAMATADATLRAKDVANDFALRKQSALNEGPEAYFNLSGQKAVDALPTVKATLATLDREAGEQLKHNPRALRMYNEQAQARNQDLLMSGMQHASRQREVWARDTAEGGIAAGIDAAALGYKDPVQVEMQLGTVSSIAYREALRRGMTETSALGAGRLARTKAAMAVANQMELHSPGESQAFLSSQSATLDQTELAGALRALAGPAAQERARDGGITKYIALKGIKVFESGTTVPGTATSTTTPPNATMHSLIATQESGGRETDARGRRITSSAGAKGVMQVMDGTVRDPGYGVRKSNGTPGGDARVGRDYYDAMLREYKGNVVLALTAYNWGPGNVNAHLRAAGDPRKGAMSDAQWLATIPNEEARNYAPSTLHRAGVDIGKSAASPSNQSTGPVAVSFDEEFDLEATKQNIIADPELSYYEKEAYIAEASSQNAEHERGRAQQQERVTNAVTEAINALPPGSFMDVNQLPLVTRLAAARDPAIQARVLQMAQANKDRAQAEQDRVEARDQAARDRAQARADALSGNVHYMQMSDAFRDHPGEAANVWSRQRVELMGTMTQSDWRHFEDMAANVRQHGGLSAAETERSAVAARIKPVLESAGLTMSMLPRGASDAQKSRKATEIRQAEDAITRSVQQWQREHPNQPVTESVMLDRAAFGLASVQVKKPDGTVEVRRAYQGTQGGTTATVSVPRVDANNIRAQLIARGLPATDRDVGNTYIRMHR